MKRSPTPFHFPIWGNGKEAIHDFSTGHWIKGTIFTALAISDVFMVKALVTGVGKVAIAGIAKLAAKDAIEVGAETGVKVGTEGIAEGVAKETAEEVGRVGAEDAAENAGERTAADCGSKIACFLGDTEVLLGDGTSEEAIQDIHVGQRVATDGGVATSPDGQAVADPNGTAVDPATWRLVTIDAADWEVQTLVPLSWIDSYNVSLGGLLPLDEVVDLAEMGVPDGLMGTVEGIGACPTIESGWGRVVLTTVHHLNDYVFNLTLSDAQGDQDTLGVTGYHKIYTEDRGWVSVCELYLGEGVRGEHGDLTVTQLVRDPGTYEVYNMTVESDHDYYVGDLTALVHNANCYNQGGPGSYVVTLADGSKYVGKGPAARMLQSALRVSTAAKQGVMDMAWTPAISDAEAFVQEAIKMREIGWLSGQLLNKINSPGERILEEVISRLGTGGL